MEPTVKFIRAKLMEARAQSEARQDLDSKLTLIRYEDIRHTQGENHTRQQISLPYKQHSSQHQRPSFSAIHLEPASTYSDKVSPNDQADTNEDEEDPDDEYEDLPQYPENNPDTVPQYSFVQQLDQNLATVRAISATHQNSLRNVRRNSATTQNKYQPGDLILWDPREHQHFFRSSKLAPKLLGPYTVSHQNRNDIHCTHCQLQTKHAFYSDRVSPFIGKSTAASHLGLLDREKYIVEAVLSHRGNFHQLKSVELLIRLAPYSLGSSDTREPWQSLRRVSALHTYLRTNNLAQYIPPAHRKVT